MATFDSGFKVITIMIPEEATKRKFVSNNYQRFILYTFSY